jgi:hypothetical protein
MILSLLSFKYALAISKTLMQFTRKSQFIVWRYFESLSTFKRGIKTLYRIIAKEGGRRLQLWHQIKRFSTHTSYLVAARFKFQTNSCLNGYISVTYHNIPLKLEKTLRKRDQKNKAKKHTFVLLQLYRKFCMMFSWFSQSLHYASFL